MHELQELRRRVAVLEVLEARLRRRKEERAAAGAAGANGLDELPLPERDAALRAHRVETMALLAAGVAHDLINLLVDIMGNLSLARLRAAGNPEVEANLSLCKEGCVRASRLAEQLLRFAGTGAQERKLQDIAAVIAESAVLATRGSKAACQLDMPDGLWPCLCDADQIAQVTANLVLNARQAMPSGGTIIVSAENVSLASGEIGVLQGGDYVRVSVRDDGEGIPPEVLPKIFEPCLTTRPEGKGLGLAVAQSIVVDHGGHIEAASEPGRGTTVTLHLPAGLALSDSETAPDPEPQDTGRTDGALR